jgi:hypothetical protein
MPALVVVALAVGTLVRADAPVGRFTINADGTVTDNMTHLTWQQAASATTYTWANAQTYCTGGWRLPNIRELQSIVDERERTWSAIDHTAFPSTPNVWFWSASPYASDVNYAWAVGFNDGHTGYLIVTSDLRVRCVR